MKRKKSPSSVQRVSKPGARQSTDLTELTPTQKEVLRLITDGCSTKEIAERLGISIRTVETHRLHIMERLGIHSIAKLVRFAILNKI